MVPASPLTAAADEISPLAQKVPPFAPTTAVDTVVATTGGMLALCFVAEGLLGRSAFRLKLFV
jgi:hypothetical protein